MNSPTNFFVIVLLCSLMLSWKVCALACDSCGNECSSACGTRHFRTCCFNYLRKRSDPSKIPTEPTRLKLELWLSKAKSQIEKEQQLLNPQNSKLHGTPNEINEQSHSLNHYYKPVRLTSQQQQDASDFNNNAAAIDSVPSEQSRVQLIYDV